MTAAPYPFTPRWYYPQTILQLYQHLEACGYPPDRFSCVRDAYQLAMTLFTSRYAFPGGKPLLDHCVGTAGILASLEAPLYVVIAGLLHNAYQVGDFGDGAEGSTPSRRGEVRRSVGERSEAVVARFAELRLRPDALGRMRADLSTLDAEGRDASLIWAVDHLEHHLDLGILYVDGGRTKESSDGKRAAALDIAEGLGLPLLEAELRRVHDETDRISASEVVGSRGGEYWMEPRSYSLRSQIRLRRLARRLRRRLRHDP